MPCYGEADYTLPLSILLALAKCLLRLSGVKTAALEPMVLRFSPGLDSFLKGATYCLLVLSERLGSVHAYCTSYT